MIDFFDNLRFWGGKRNKLLSALKFYQFANGGSQLLANLILPVYFVLTKKKYRLIAPKKSTGRVIVSLTSFPARISKVYLVIESLFRQSCLPDKIILYLSQDQFPAEEKLPKTLLEQRLRGLEIVFSKGDMRSHKKYLTAFREYPNDIIITVDDDIFYRSDFIAGLLNWHSRFPHAIITNWTKKIIFDYKGCASYAAAPDASQKDIGKENSHNIVIGVAGNLYPPKAVYKDCLEWDLIKRLAFTTDDIWLSAMAILAGTSFVYTGYKQNHLPVMILGNKTLLAENKIQNQICMDKINSYYAKVLGYAPFSRK